MIRKIFLTQRIAKFICTFLVFHLFFIFKRSTWKVELHREQWGREKKREKEIYIERSYIHWFAPYMAVIAKVGLAEIRRVGFNLVPLHGWQGPKHCASFNSFSKQLEWKWIGSRGRFNSLHHNPIPSFSVYLIFKNLTIHLKSFYYISKLKNQIHFCQFCSVSAPCIDKFIPCGPYRTTANLSTGLFYYIHHFEDIKHLWKHNYGYSTFVPQWHSML